MGTAPRHETAKNHRSWRELSKVTGVLIAIDTMRASTVIYLRTFIDSPLMGGTPAQRLTDTPSGTVLQRVAHSGLGVLLVLACLVAPGSLAMAKEPTASLIEADATWTELLQECVVEINNGGSTAVDYECFSQRRNQLTQYLQSLSHIERVEYGNWNRDQQLAFLINAYNAYTVELILGAWPDIESIRDLGNLIFSPWKKSFIPLLGETVSLDDIEHGMIREPGVFDEPRIHFAVNCASIGCPALRREAYTSAEIQQQLEDQTQRFLGDRTRNRLSDDKLLVTSLFKWYGDDFTAGWRGANSIEGFVALYADALGLSESQVRRLKNGEIDIDFLKYDWALNSL